MTYPINSLYASTNPLKSQQHPLSIQRTSLLPFITGLFLATTGVLKGWLPDSQNPGTFLTKAARGKLQDSSLKTQRGLVENHPLLIILAISAPEKELIFTTPWYLFAVLPALNFFVLFLCLRFAPWYLLHGAIAILFGLAMHFPPTYWRVCGFSLSVLIIFLL